MDLWNQEVERDFFQKPIHGFASPEQLFCVTDDNRYVAYWPKNYQGQKSTLQSRNALIGNFTETWTRELLANCLARKNTIKTTIKKGFIRFDSYESLKHSIVELLSMKLNFFSSMKSKEELGRCIEIANKEPTYEQKAETFLKLLESEENG